MATGRTEREALAQLGLVVLIYGVAIAPVVHAVVGHGVQDTDETWSTAWVDHGHSATHSPPPDESRPHSHPRPGSPAGATHSHNPDGLEHLSASVLAPSQVPWKPTVVEVIERVAVSAERPRAGEPHQLPAMPQGP